MAASSFHESLRRLLAHEGGYTNHPSDPGGPTNFGITLADYRRYVKSGATAADVRAMPVAQAKAIYRAQYWNALRCDELPAGVDDSVFDYGVNSGVARSGKVLRRVLGLTDSDWRVTDDVLRALGKRRPASVIGAINDERMRFLRSLKTWPVFGAGWSRRVSEVRAHSLALAAATPSGDASAASLPSLGETADTAARVKGQVTSKTRKSVIAGAVVVGGAAGTVAGDMTSGVPTVVALLAGALLAGLIVWLGLRWWRRYRQERAMVGTIIIPETTS